MHTQDRLGNTPVEEQLVTLNGVNWAQFKSIEANLQGVRAVRLTYFQGALEIVSPISDEHETIKSTLGALLEAYMCSKEIRHYRRGGFTLEAEGYASGTPDEFYSIKTRRDLPDLVIEVIVTSGSINRKTLYLPLRIPEIWFWQAGKIRIVQLEDQEYRETNRSQFFPDLDISLLLKYIDHPDQYDAIQEFLVEVGQ
ncbi:hypothetical protein C7271_18415 [filamentous cyanobacterium CCP5]|nr:hypothetical protein C7271_18415 [filamentous cyanobacterium CCP5]